MTAGQARGALLGFALVLAGVTVNAIYLQERERATVREAARQASRPERKPVAAAPAPYGPRGGAASEAPLRIARFGSPPVPVPSQASVDQETVRAIQRELSARGFGPLPNDGNLGLLTRAAIIAYEQDQRLPLKAAASEELLRRLVLGTTPAAPAAPGEEASSGQAASPEAEAVIASVQRSLAQLGYRPGRADGQLGEETARAIHDFEVDRGMVPKGRISAELVRQLEAVQRASGR